MSRIIFPFKFNAQLDLLAAVKQKHDADGPASVLLPYLAEHEIDLTIDELAAAEARQHEKKHAQLKRDAEMYKAGRDLKFKPVMDHLRGSARFLKALLSLNTRELGLWGLTINGKGRIAYPADFNQRAELFRMVKEKHDSYPVNTSPLQPYLNQHEIDLNDDNTAVNKAVENHKKFNGAAKEAEIEKEQRDLFWKPVVKHLQGIGAYLKKLFDLNDQEVSAWGYTIRSAPTAAKIRKSRLKPGFKTKVKGVVLDKTFQNTGKAELHLYKGSTGKAAPVAILPGEDFILTKGFSTVTVVNVSSIETGEFRIPIVN